MDIWQGCQNLITSTFSPPFEPWFLPLMPAKLYQCSKSGLKSTKKVNVNPAQEKQVLYSKNENSLSTAMLHCQVHRGCNHESAEMEESACLGMCPWEHISSAWPTGNQGIAPCFNFSLHHNTHHQQPYYNSGKYKHFNIVLLSLTTSQFWYTQVHSRPTLPVSLAIVVLSNHNLKY